MIKRAEEGCSVTTMPSYGQLMGSSLDDETSFGDDAQAPAPPTNFKKRVALMTIEVSGTCTLYLQTAGFARYRRR